MRVESMRTEGTQGFRAKVGDTEWALWVVCVLRSVASQLGWLRGSWIYRLG
jgi:hypothetical protein